MCAMQKGGEGARDTRSEGAVVSLLWEASVMERRDLLGAMLAVFTGHLLPQPVDETVWVTKGGVGRQDRCMCNSRGSIG